jgi:hypothetical protein
MDGKRVFERWLQTRYHQPNDDVRQPISYEAGVRGAKYLFLLGYTVATDPDRPRWKPGDFFGDTFGRAAPGR